MTGERMVASPVVRPRSPSKTPKSTNWKGAEAEAKVVSARLRQARVYNGYTIEEASERFGYKGNKTQLSLIETGERPAPIHVLFKATRIYGVSLDYLCGLVDEEEATARDCERAALHRYIERVMSDSGTRMLTTMTRIMSGAAPSVSISRVLVDRVGEMVEAFDRFVAKNPGFEDMPLGATALARMEALTVQYRASKHAIERYDNFGERAIELEEIRLGMTKPLFANGA